MEGGERVRRIEVEAGEGGRGRKLEMERAGRKGGGVDGREREGKRERGERGGWVRGGGEGGKTSSNRPTPVLGICQEKV